MKLRGIINRRAMIAFDEFLIVILVILVIAAVLILIFRADVLTYLRNLPGYGVPEDEEVDLTGERDVEVPLEHSKIVKITFTENVNDEVFVSWVFGKGPTVLIRPNGKKILIDGKEVWIYSLDNRLVFSDDSIKNIDPRDLESIKDLLTAEKPVSLSVKVWSLKDVLINSRKISEIDKLSEINKMFYGLETAPEDPNYKIDEKEKTESWKLYN